MGRILEAQPSNQKRQSRNNESIKSWHVKLGKINHGLVVSRRQGLIKRRYEQCSIIGLLIDKEGEKSSNALIGKHKKAALVTECTQKLNFELPNTNSDTSLLHTIGASGRKFYIQKKIEVKDIYIVPETASGAKQ